MWQAKLISLYCAVCDNSSIIEREMQRQSNKFRPQFTDEACITVYLWGISQRRFEQKAIYNYTKSHLSEWFPKLPSYQAFSRRCNALAPPFRALAERWMEQTAPSCADVHDLTAAKQMTSDCPFLRPGWLYCGKAYVDADRKETLEKEYGVQC